MAIPATQKNLLNLIFELESSIVTGTPLTQVSILHYGEACIALNLNDCNNAAYIFCNLSKLLYQCLKRKNKALEVDWHSSIVAVQALLLLLIERASPQQLAMMLVEPAQTNSGLNALYYLHYILAKCHFDIIPLWHKIFLKLLPTQESDKLFVDIIDGEFKGQNIFCSFTGVFNIYCQNYHAEETEPLINVWNDIVANLSPPRLYHLFIKKIFPHVSDCEQRTVFCQLIISLGYSSERQNAAIVESMASVLEFAIKRLTRNNMRAVLEVGMDRNAAGNNSLYHMADALSISAKRNQAASFLALNQLLSNFLDKIIAMPDFYKILIAESRYQGDKSNALEKLLLVLDCSAISPDEFELYFVNLKRVVTVVFQQGDPDAVRILIVTWRTMLVKAAAPVQDWLLQQSDEFKIISNRAILIDDAVNFIVTSNSDESEVNKFPPVANLAHSTQFGHSGNDSAIAAGGPAEPLSLSGGNN